MMFIKRLFYGVLLVLSVLFVTAQASGGIVEFWAPGPDLVVKNFEIVDLGLYTVPHLKCNNFGSRFTFVYGLADTVFATVSVNDTTKICIAFINVNPVTDEMFPTY